MNKLGMSNTKITEICSNHYHTKPYFRGVYASNKLKTVRIPDNPPYFIICNTSSDESSRTIGHWTVIYRSKEYRTDYFCSLGLKPQGEVLSYVENLDPNYSYNILRYQDYESTSCGEMCLFYADFRVQGYTNEDTLDLFSTTKLKMNDFLSRNYVYGHMLE